MSSKIKGPEMSDRFMMTRPRMSSRDRTFNHGRGLLLPDDYPQVEKSSSYWQTGCRGITRSPSAGCVAPVEKLMSHT